MTRPEEVRMAADQLEDALQKLVASGLSSMSFGRSELVQVLIARQPERPTQDWFPLVYRVVAGAGIDAEPSAMPSDPRFTAARVLYGVAPGMAGATAKTRRDEASRYLRDRRPKDPYKPADAPLEGKQQTRKLHELIGTIAADLARVLDEPLPTLAPTSSVVYEVIAVDYTLRCGPDGRAGEKIEDWSFVARRPMTHFPKTWALGPQQPDQMEMYCIGGQLAKTYDQKTGVLVTEIIFGKALQPGEARTVRLVTRFPSGDVDRHLTARSTRPAGLLRIRLQLPANRPARYAPIAQAADYEDHQFGSLPHTFEIDPRGYAEVEFTDMLADFNYGIAWRVDRQQEVS